MNDAFGPRGDRRSSSVAEELLSSPGAEADHAAELADRSAAFEGAHPRDVLTWALTAYAGKITVACSFGGPSGMAILDMVAALDVRTPVFYLDTDVLFPETLALIARVRDRYGLEPVAVRSELTLEAQAATYGDALWERDPDRCCALRKVAPQRAYLRGFDAWISGIRRDQGPTRAQTPIVAWDARASIVKINPLAGWTERDVWRYIAEHDVPTSELHGRGYASVGCMPCTRPVQPGEDARAGRWSGFAKTECGLHVAAPTTTIGG